jgi:DNA-binding transcriptional MerR regulator
MYTIGEFSELAQVSIKTLRHYDATGILRPARVGRSTGYRYYAAWQVGQLNRILGLKDFGFSLREIGMLSAENVPADQVRGLAQRKRRELEEQVERERARLSRATAGLDTLEHFGTGGNHAIAVRNVGARMVASIRGTIGEHDEAEGLLDELLHHVRAGRTIAPRGAIWHACEAGRIDCEVFVRLRSRIDGSARVRVREIPRHRVVSLVYRGDKDYLPVYRVARAWIAASGLEVRGPKSEIYLEEGGPDVESCTEIQFPICFPSARLQ